MIKNKQSTRSLIAFLMTWSFLILTVTGIVLYIVPQGRIAYWTHWSLVGLEKEQWGGVHMIFGGVFILTGVLHLYFNWKPFKRYLLERVKGQLQIKQELLVSLVLSLSILLMSIYRIPPVSWVFDLNDWVKQAWVTSPELEPPFGHAEEISLKAISRRMDLDYQQAHSRLEQAGLSFSGDDSLEAIAERNTMTPMEVYGLFSDLKQQEEVADLSQLSSVEIEARFAGTGLGRKTVALVSQQIGLDNKIGLRRLKAAGIEADGSETLRELADGHQISPIDVLKLLLKQEPVED